MWGVGGVNSLPGTGFWLHSTQVNDDDLAIMIMMMFLLWYMMMMDNMAPFLLMMMITIMMILYCNATGEQLLWYFTPSLFQPHHQLPLFHIMLKGECFLHFFCKDEDWKNKVETICNILSRIAALVHLCHSHMKMVQFWMNMSGF